MLANVALSLSLTWFVWFYIACAPCCLGPAVIGDCVALFQVSIVTVCVTKDTGDPTVLSSATVWMEARAPLRMARACVLPVTVAPTAKEVRKPNTGPQSKDWTLPSKKNDVEMLALGPCELYFSRDANASRFLIRRKLLMFADYAERFWASRAVALEIRRVEEWQFGGRKSI